MIKNTIKLLESIRVVDRRLENIVYHNQRINQSRKVLLGLETSWDLAEIILIPENINEKVYKCRVTYAEGIESIEFIPYQVREIRSLRLIEANQMDYPHKFANRIDFEKIMQLKGDCDDILIVKNGFITDTSYCNVAFWDGIDWLTPAFPLLKGTQRAFLLDKQILKTKNISSNDLNKFLKIKLFNALMPWENCLELPISQIVI